ncbi:polyamine ABC transporter substrate-binding protein [Hansschlegelia beijingensis]|uniref:Putrescine-binding periplasmic protein n=1 Tax=Hansschlegelia beijingensis TaxID=1133344 RepID=A0A7W6GER8_9HYPH|nr:polyamine ABC transporter substrate-binding protein [Hansschlegelia beijingensis]MBB3973171.1 putrescine transport system substrate-binding protein [Hansschlegelia beijingensis]
MTIRGLVGACLAAFGLASGAVGGALAAGKEVRIYNWSDYIDPQILKDFEAETGIKVVYDVFDSNEILETKLLTGKTGYDLVVPTATFLSRQIKAGVFQKLDKSKLPNLVNAWPEIYERVAKYDPDNAYSINYMWGTTGIGYNVDKVKKAFPDAPLDSWSLVYDPANLQKLSKCGVMLLDSPEDLLPSVLTYLGLPPDWSDVKNVQKAADHLAKLKPYITKFHSSEYINALANGNVCVAVGYSGDILQAKSRAAEADKGVKVEYSLPKEGAQLWFDQMAMPADAPHPEEAHAFINYMLKPEVAAKASNFVQYANGNLKSQEFLDAEVKDNPSIYPTPEVFARLYTVPTIEDPKIQRALTRAWTKAKSGK